MSEISDSRTNLNIIRNKLRAREKKIQGGKPYDINARRYKKTSPARKNKGTAVNNSEQ